MSEAAIIYGINPVQAALKEGRVIEKILISEKVSSNRLQAVVQTARQQHVLVQSVPPAALTKKVGNNKHQGILAFLGVVESLSLEELLQKCKNVSGPPLLTMLDSIEDPHNLGAIIRSAEAAGFVGIILPQRRSAPLSPIVSKTSAGAIQYLPIAKVGNLVQSLEQLKEAGFWILGSDERASTSFWEIPDNVPLVVIVGNEGQGIHRLLKEKCDFLVRIPMYGKTESLNASVAAALLFYEIRRQREASVSSK